MAVIKRGSVEFRVGHLSVKRAAGAPYSSLSTAHEGAPSWPVERAGVRAGSTCSLPPRPHPNPLPGGEGIKPVVLGIVAPTRNSTKPKKGNGLTTKPLRRCFLASLFVAVAGCGAGPRVRRAQALTARVRCFDLNCGAFEATVQHEF